MPTKAYEEIIDFIAAGSTPREVVEYRPSEGVQARVEELIEREKAGALNPCEAEELQHYLQLEHIMRLARARARQHVGPK